jgi:hypothetical protein
MLALLGFNKQNKDIEKYMFCLKVYKGSTTVYFDDKVTIYDK